MGMFDYITCKYPLPIRDLKIKFNDFEFQTKDTPRQMCEHYEIDEDGRLKWRMDEIHPKTDEVISSEWIPASGFKGEIRFYGSSGNSEPNDSDAGWIEFAALFYRGVLRELCLVSYRRPSAGEYEVQRYPSWNTNYLLEPRIMSRSDETATMNPITHPDEFEWVLDCPRCGLADVSLTMFCGYACARCFRSWSPDQVETQGRWRKKIKEQL